jgi:hypothetical protein
LYFRVTREKGRSRALPPPQEREDRFLRLSPLAAGLLTGRYKNKDEIAKNASHFSHPMVLSLISSPLFLSPSLLVANLFVVGWTFQWTVLQGYIFHWSFRIAGFPQKAQLDFH